MSKHPVIHLLHDAGLAAWAGGSLMGAVGLNGAAASLDDPVERMRASTAGWSRWAPVAGTAVAAHLVGSIGLSITDSARVRRQDGVGRSSAVKAGLTGAGVGIAAWSAVLNRKMAAAGPGPVRGATEPGAGTPTEVAATQRQLGLVQWLNPLVSTALLVATAVHEEQMRTAEQARGRLRGAAAPALLTAGVAGLGLLAARRRRRGTSIERTSTIVAPGVVDLTDGPDAAANGQQPVVSGAGSRPGAVERPTT